MFEEASLSGVNEGRATEKLKPSQRRRRGYSCILLLSLLSFCLQGSQEAYWGMQ